MIRLNEGAYPYMEEVNEGILRNVTSSRFPKGSRFLDVGCGQAALGGEIQKLGHVVWGIEKSELAAVRAKTRIDRCIQTDLLDTAGIKTALGDARFDAVILSDVLEHLYDPLSSLKFYLSYLKPGGRALISVPNALNWECRIRFLFGQFEYQDTGVMDRTHVRFFTFRTLENLVTAAGCTVEKRDFTPYIVRALLPWIKNRVKSKKENTADISNLQLYRVYMQYFYPIEHFLASAWKPLFAFRIILVVRKNET